MKAVDRTERGITDGGQSSHPSPLPARTGPLALTFSPLASLVGRGDRRRGAGYPIGYVRWTEQRNMEAFLEQCAAKRLDLAPLVLCYRANAGAIPADSWIHDPAIGSGRS